MGLIRCFFSAVPSELSTRLDEKIFVTYRTSLRRLVLDNVGSAWDSDSGFISNPSGGFCRSVLPRRITISGLDSQ